MSKCIVVIDMQNDFVTGTLGTKEAREMLPQLVEKLTKEDMPLIFTKDTHGENYLATQEGKKLPVKHCIKGTWGWEIVDELKPFIKNYPIIEKNTFGSVDLPRFVANFSEIELVGLCTDICVISNALLLKANFPEKCITVNAVACAGVTPASHENALSAMKMCQINID